MLLNICTEFSFVNSVNNNYIYITLICFILIISAILLKSKKIINYKAGYKITLFSALGICFMFNLLLLFSTVYANENSGCVCQYREYKEIPSLFTSNINKDLKKVIDDKIIIVGDSRMDYIISDKEKFNIPINYTFIAKSGADIGWLKNKGLPDLYKVLDNRNYSYKYHVVINLGVNDVQYYKDYEPKINEYINIYHSLIAEYPNVNFYLLSVNPINDKKLNKSQPDNIRTTKKVEYFNYRLEEDVDKMDKHNYSFCDSYHDIYFHTLDGLHYTTETGQEILNYIAQKCVVFE